MTDLNLLDAVILGEWIEIVPTDINNNGQITGFGRLAIDPEQVQPFLLSYTSDTVFNPQSI